MKITFLGTGAADWSYDIHKDVEGFRRNSSALIDDCLLIDPGPDVPNALSAFGKDANAIKYIINTHTHSDHYNADTVAALSHATLYSFLPGEVKTVGRYQITALPANHVPGKNTVHFIIYDGSKRLFYGLDGAWLLYEEFTAIKSCGVDLAVLDATLGDVPGDYRIFEHNNLNMVVEMKRSLAPYVKRFCITHVSRTLSKPYEVLVSEMQPHGIEVAFDGYETEI